MILANFLKSGIVSLLNDLAYTWLETQQYTVSDKNYVVKRLMKIVLKFYVNVYVFMNERLNKAISILGS